MSKEAMQAVLASDVSHGTDRVVELAIAWLADANGEDWHGVAKHAELANVSVRTAQRSHKWLEEHGRLTIVPHGAPVGGRWQQRPNLYRLAMTPFVTTRHDASELPVVTDRASSGDNLGTGVVTQGVTLLTINNHLTTRSCAAEELVDYCANIFAEHGRKRPRVSDEWYKSAEEILASHEPRCARSLVKWAATAPTWRSRRLPDLVRHLRVAERTFFVGERQCYCERVHYDTEAVAV